MLAVNKTMLTVHLATAVMLIKKFRSEEPSKLLGCQHMLALGMPAHLPRPSLQATHLL